MKTWLYLREIDDNWVCKNCGFEDKLSQHLKHRGDWKFRKSGLFSKDNNQEGAIPVILTLLQLYRVFHMRNFIYSTSLNLGFDKTSCEIDFCAIQYGDYDRKVIVGIGECKSEKGKIDNNDIDNLLKVKDRLEKKGIQCFLIFSKTADNFNAEEIELFKKIAEKDICPALFTNKELEPYEIYDEYERDKLPSRYAVTLSAIAQNSYSIYFGN